MRLTSIRALLALCLMAGITIPPPSHAWISAIAKAGSAAGKASKIGTAGKLAGTGFALGELAPLIAKLHLPPGVAAVEVGIKEGGLLNMATRHGNLQIASPGGAAQALRDAKLLQPGEQPMFVLNAEEVFNQPRLFSELASQGELHLGMRDATVRAYPASDGGFDVALRPGILAHATDFRGLESHLLRLERAVNRSNIRSLALDPAVSKGPGIIPLSRSGGLPDVEPIDPARLVEQLRPLKGQTVVMTGRIENGFLLAEARGKSSNIPLAELRGAADEAGVDLILVGSRSVQQPIGKGIFGGVKQIEGSEAASQAITWGDLLQAFTKPEAPLILREGAAHGNRIAMTAEFPKPSKPDGGSVAMNALEAARLGTHLVRIQEHGVAEIQLYSDDDETFANRDKGFWERYGTLILGFLFLNIILGLMLGSTPLVQLFQWTWPDRLVLREHYGPWWQRSGVKLLRLMMIFLLLLPFFGGLCALLALLHGLWRVVSYPFRRWGRGKGDEAT